MNQKIASKYTQVNNRKIQGKRGPATVRNHLFTQLWALPTGRWTSTNKWGHIEISE